MFESVKKLLIEQLKLKDVEITPDSRIKEDLKADSLDVLQLHLVGEILREPLLLAQVFCEGIHRLRLVREAEITAGTAVFLKFRSFDLFRVST